jgi:protein CpxP
MRCSLRVAAVLGAATAALSLSTLVNAQDRGGPPSGPPTEAQRAEWKQAHEQERAKVLHDVLNLRPDQDAAFQAFQADMRPPARGHNDHDGRGDMGRMQALTTPERLDRMAEMMSARSAEQQTEFRRRADAIKRFYAVLDPGQKRAFDALHDMAGGHRGRGGEHGGPGHDGPAGPGGDGPGHDGPGHDGPGERG